MGEFRIGRKFAQHSYPEAPRGGSVLSALARNFASGPSSTSDIDSAGTPVPWSSIDSTGAPGTDVPITPRATGVILISGVLTVKSLSGVQETVIVQVFVDGSPLLVPFFEQVTIEPAVTSGGTAIPILTEINAHTNGAVLPVGVAANISVVLFASSDGVLQLTTDSSSLAVQEVTVATG